MGKFDGILLLSDMDGTLLDDQKQISSKNRQEIERFTEAGGIFCMATGRPPMTTVDFEPFLPPNMPKVYLNGALIRSGDGAVMQACQLQSEIWTLIGQITKQFPQVGCELFAEDRIYLYQASPESMQHQQMSHCEFTDFAAFRKTDVLYKANFTGQPDILRQVREVCAAMLEHYAVASSTPTFLEVTQMQANKGEALRLLKHKLHARRAYAIGDSGNDLPMLQAADFAFAPANADAEILQCADCVVGRNTEDAIAQAIAQIECAAKQ